MVTENSENLAGVISSTETALAGKNGNAVTKVTLNMEALKKNIPEELLKKNPDGIKALTQAGIEYETPKDIFNKYFKDDYITTAIENERLKNGITASSFVKDNLHYDYTITEGANDTYVVHFGTKQIDPTTNQEIWKYEPSNTIFPKTMGLSAVMKVIQDYGYNNTVAINNYYKNVSQQNNPFKKLPNETVEQYASRLSKMHNGQ